mmetsp:Transcript_59425/g.106007  ORF Transcript_59425/g.106007 Transcript_59425/m.106007 type:complete len:390 (+) Transcript_59425:476-1645(+)
MSVGTVWAETVSIPGEWHHDGRHDSATGGQPLLAEGHLRRHMNQHGEVLLVGQQRGLQLLQPLQRWVVRKDAVRSCVQALAGGLVGGVEGQWFIGHILGDRPDQRVARVGRKGLGLRVGGQQVRVVPPQLGRERDFGSHALILLLPLLRQPHLVHPLPEPGLRGVIELGMAPGAGHPSLIKGRQLVALIHGLPAGEAHVVVALLKTVLDRHTAVEHEALPLPHALLLRDHLQVLEDTPFQLVHLVKALLLHEGRRLLAPDAPGARHHDLLLFGRLAQRRHVVRELAEGVGLGIHCPFESPNAVLVGVAHVNHKRLGVLEEGIPLLRLDVLPSVLRVEVLNPHGDNLLLYAHLHPPERLLVRLGVLGLEVMQPRVGAEERQEGLDILLGP